MKNKMVDMVNDINHTNVNAVEIGEYLITQTFVNHNKACEVYRRVDISNIDPRGVRFLAVFTDHLVASRAIDLGVFDEVED